MTKILLFLSIIALINAHSLISTPRDKHLIEVQKQRQNTSEETSSPLTGFIFGPMLFIIAFPVIWFNERRYLIDQYRINQAFKECKETQFLDRSNENCLIFTCGKSSTDEVLTDQQFAVSDYNLYKLSRVAKMFQWVEVQKTDNQNNTYYEYVREWREDFVNSSSFNNQSYYNDESYFIVKSQMFKSQHVQINQLVLSEAAIDQITTNTQVNITQVNVTQAMQSQQSPTHKQCMQVGNSIQFKVQPNMQSLGDIEVQFYKYQCGPLSIIGQQIDNTIQSHKIHDKYDDAQPKSLSDVHTCCCTQMCDFVKKMEAPLSEILWVNQSETTKFQMFQDQLSDDATSRWVILFAGYIIMCLGIICFFSPISNILYYIPLFGSLLAYVFTLAITIIAMIIAFVFTLITFALAWLFYRPFVALGLILVSGLIVGGCFFIT